LQNIPSNIIEGKSIRRSFVAHNNNVFVSFDYSQIEIRLLAHLANVKVLRNYLKKNYDIHKITASQIFDIPFSRVTPNLRDQAKTINFGIIYGLSSFGLSKQLNISKAYASKYINAYLNHYTGISSYINHAVNQAKNFGYVYTLLGRKCYIKDINSKNIIKRQFAERQAINASLQGSAADIIRKSIIDIYNSLRSTSLKAFMIMHVHDEIVFEVNKLEVNSLKALVLPLMENIVPLTVPLKVDIRIKDNWCIV
jgi:DNA polymerase-1